MEQTASKASGMAVWMTRDGMKQARGIILAEGIILLLCGIFAVAVSPYIASNILILIMGWIALICGAAMLVRSFTRGAGTSGLDIVNAIMVAGLGVLFLLWPFESLEVVTLVLAGWCIIRGLMDVTGIPQRLEVAPGVQFVGGLFSIILAVLLIIWWPADALWAPGLLFGIQLLFLGIGLLVVWNKLGDGGTTASPPASVVR